MLAHKSCEHKKTRRQKTAYDIFVKDDYPVRSFVHSRCHAKDSNIKNAAQLTGKK